jgi:hypothetical protein
VYQPDQPSIEVYELVDQRTSGIDHNLNIVPRAPGINLRSVEAGAHRHGVNLVPTDPLEHSTETLQTHSRRVVLAPASMDPTGNMRGVEEMGRDPIDLMIDLLEHSMEVVETHHHRVDLEPIDLLERSTEVAEMHHRQVDSKPIDRLERSTEVAEMRHLRNHLVATDQLEMATGKVNFPKKSI